MKYFYTISDFIYVYQFQVYLICVIVLWQAIEILRSDLIVWGGEMYQKKDIMSRKARFTQAFPEIADLNIEVRLKQTRIDVDLPYRTYTIENPPDEIIGCNAINCSGGGIPIHTILKEMIRNRLTILESKEICNGEVGPVLTKLRGKCLKSFRIKIFLTYPDA